MAFSDLCQRFSDASRACSLPALPHLNVRHQVQVRQAPRGGQSVGKAFLSSPAAAGPPLPSEYSIWKSQVKASASTCDFYHTTACSPWAADSALSVQYAQHSWHWIRNALGSEFLSPSTKTGHPNRMPCFSLERATRLELATSTLARWRSTR